MCPYYLDGDLTELGRARSVIPVATAAYRARWLWLLCSFQGPPRGRWAGRLGTRAEPAGTGLSKLNSMRGLEPDG